MLEFSERNYPWARYLTVRDGHDAPRVMDSRQAAFRWENGEMDIRSTPGLFVRVRSNMGPIRSMSGVEVVYRYRDMNETVLKAASVEAVLRL